jgi:hypothetical protein
MACENRAADASIATFTKSSSRPKLPESDGRISTADESTKDFVYVVIFWHFMPWHCLLFRSFINPTVCGQPLRIFHVKRLAARNRKVMMNNFHKEFPKAIDDYMKGTNKVNVEKIAKGIVNENAALVNGLNTSLGKSIINAEIGISPQVTNMKNYIRADVKATLLSLGKLGKMNEQAPLIAANLKAVPGYKGGFAGKALKGWAAISLAIDVVSTVSKTSDAVAERRYADATKAALGGSVSIGAGALAGLAIGKFVILGLATGPVGWVVIAVGAAAVGYAAGEVGTAVGEGLAEKANEQVGAISVT